MEIKKILIMKKWVVDFKKQGRTKREDKIMSMTLGAIAIKGSFLTNTAMIFQMFELVETADVKTLDSWENVEPIIEKEYIEANDEGMQKRVCWEDNGWTIIEDFSLLLCTDEEALRNLSKELDTTVFSMATQGTSGSYGFCFFDENAERIFFLSDGEVIQNDGHPLEFEKIFNISENVTYDDILGLAKAIGVIWENRNKKNSFLLKTYVDSPELKKELEEIQKKQVEENAKGQKPW